MTVRLAVLAAECDSECYRKDSHCRSSYLQVREHQMRPRCCDFGDIVVAVEAEGLIVEDAYEASCQSCLATRPFALSPPVGGPVIVVAAQQRLVLEYMKADGLGLLYVPATN